MDWEIASFSGDARMVEKSMVGGFSGLSARLANREGLPVTDLSPCASTALRALESEVTSSCGIGGMVTMAFLRSNRAAIPSARRFS